VFADPDMTAVAESSEAESSRMFEEAPAEIKRTLGLATKRIAGGIATSMLNDPAHYWSKALGFGITEPVTTEVIGQICDFYRENGIAQAQIAIAPSLLPPDWNQICSRHGLSAGSRRIKLACRVRDFRPARSSQLRIGRVDAEQADAAGRLLAGGFGMDSLADLFASVFRTGTLHAFGAWDGERMIGTSVLRLGGTAAQFHGAVTHPAYRRSGVHHALLTARAQAASDAGSTWLVSEVMPSREGAANSSLDHMLAVGFSILYERRSWIWTSTP
jgi:GNAT superfamily N-acetyltransferase